MATPASMVERALEAFGAKAKVPPLLLCWVEGCIIPPIYMPCTPKDLCIPQEFLRSESAMSCQNEQGCSTFRGTSGSCSMVRRAVHA